MGEGESLLSSVRLKSDAAQVNPADYRSHIRQEPNLRWLSTIKVPLGIYCLSGTNDRLLFNRIMHRIGEAPVVYNDTLMRHSQASLVSALRTKGYLQATVDTEVQHKGQRTHLIYRMKPGRRSYVQSLRHLYDSDTIAAVVRADSSRSLLYRGMPLDLSVLDAERNRIVQLLQNKGFANINNEFVSYTADTTAVIWGKIEDKGKYALNMPWAYYVIDNNSKYVMPRLADMSMTLCGDLLLAVGGKGIAPCKVEAFDKIYTSGDMGITWVNDARYQLPEGIDKNATSMALVTDSGNHLWIICAGTGQIWRGRLNSMGWQSALDGKK